MKYIFFSFNGLGYPIAYKLKQEGCEVIVGRIENIDDYVIEEEIGKTTESPEARRRRLNLFKNMLEFKPAGQVVEMMKKIKNPHEYFVFFEENNLYRWADKVSDLGFEGNFPTKEDYLLEIDRDKAKEFVSKHYPKLSIPYVKKFDRTEDAINFLKTTEELWVLKGNDDHAKAFLSDTSDPKVAAGQVIEVLQNFPELYEKKGFILESFILSIIELTPERMYYDGVPLLTTIAIENKPFGSGNLSVQTGCSEDLVFPIGPDSRINSVAFPEIVDDMARKHKGLFIWDASILIGRRDGKMYFGEFCSNRPGYNSFFSELAQAASVNSFFENLVHKKPPLNLGTVASSVRLFNMNRDEETEQVSSDLKVTFDKSIEKDVWLWDVKQNRQGHLVSVGTDWNLAVITGSGKSIDEALTQTYKNVDNFSFVGCYYRSFDDYVSLDYQSSILNRLNYGLDKGLYTLPFNVKAGTIKTKLR